MSEFTSLRAAGIVGMLLLPRNPAGAAEKAEPDLLYRVLGLEAVLGNVCN